MQAAPAVRSRDGWRLLRDCSMLMPPTWWRRPCSSAVFVIFCAKIIARYGEHSEMAWADEISTILFIWIIFWANSASCWPIATTSASIS